MTQAAGETTKRNQRRTPGHLPRTTFRSRWIQQIRAGRSRQTDRPAVMISRTPNAVAQPASRLLDYSHTPKKTETDRGPGSSVRKDLFWSLMEARGRAGTTAAKPPTLTLHAMKKLVTLTVDGACLGNGQSQSRAAAAGILNYQGHRRAVAEYIGQSTNQRAEILSAACGLEALKEPCQVISPIGLTLCRRNDEWQVQT